MSVNKTILALIGTSRKKSTYNILKMFESELEKYDFTMEYVFLHKIEFCTGCELCLFHGIEKCPNFADVEEIINKMSKADVLFFATPVYCDFISGIMKNFIDRMVYFMHRPWLFDKHSFLLATIKYSGGKETLDYLDNVARRWVCFPIGRLIVRMSLHERDPEPIAKEIKKLSKEIHTKVLKNQKPKLGLYDLSYFRIMRVMITFAKKELPLDYEHWKEKGWLESDFYCDANIPLSKNLLAKFIESRVQKALNKL